MKFTSKHRKTPRHIGEVVGEELGVLDPYCGGAVEHLEEKVANLTQLLCVLAELMPPDQQIALLAHIAPSYEPVEEV